MFNTNVSSISTLAVFQLYHGVNKCYELISSTTEIENRNKFINQIRAPGGHIQITIMIDTQQQYKTLRNKAHLCRKPRSEEISKQRDNANTNTRGGSLKLEKNKIFWRKIVIFDTKYPKYFRAYLRSAQFLSVPPSPNLKSWNRS